MIILALLCAFMTHCVPASDQIDSLKIFSLYAQALQSRQPFPANYVLRSLDSYRSQLKMDVKKFIKLKVMLRIHPDKTQNDSIPAFIDRNEMMSRFNVIMNGDDEFKRDYRAEMEADRKREQEKRKAEKENERLRREKEMAEKRAREEENRARKKLAKDKRMADQQAKREKEQSKRNECWESLGRDRAKAKERSRTEAEQEKELSAVDKFLFEVREGKYGKTRHLYWKEHAEIDDICDAAWKVSEDAVANSTETKFFLKSLKRFCSLRPTP